MQFPHVVKTAFENEGIILSLYIDEELEAFKGHFDSTPIVPGVCQIHWVLHFSQEHFEELDVYYLPGCVERLEKIKFQHVIQPEMEIELRLKLVKNAIMFSFVSDRKHSSGKIVFE